MKMPEIDAHTFLSGLAMIFLGVLAGCLLFFPIPDHNHDAVTYVLGVFSGVVTSGGANAIRQSIKTP